MEYGKKHLRPIVFYTLTLLVFLVWTGITSAEITNPYVVDEKPQVLFSDSIEIISVITSTSGDVATTTYYGLENYTQVYVRGFNHFSFTYTHHRCCYSSYPPSLYISDVDPRLTSAPIERIIFKVLDAQSLYWYGPTDWYLIDVQFDATGFTIIIKQAGVNEIWNEHTIVTGQTDNDWVALANKYLLYNTPSQFSMTFTPVPIVKSPVSTRNPVIIIPGIMGSYLNREDGTEVWMNLLKMLLPGDDSYLDELSLSTSSEPVNNPALVPTDILRRVLTRDFFGGTINYLESIGYQEGVDLFVFPYDWRLDMGISAETLSEKINQIKLETGAQKIDVIAHSMGGLIFKQYLMDHGGNLIDKFVDIGTPQVGAPNAFKIISYGDNIGFSFQGKNILNPERAKIISQNMPSVYQLLPTRKYFDLYPSYVYDLDDLDGNGERGNLNYDQTKEFLKNTGRNALLTDRADEFHGYIDNLNPADYGVETYNIVGCGVQTLGKIFILNKETSGGVEYNISYTNGDGTVPLKSAENIPSLKTYYVKNAVHATMPSLTGVKELVASILNDDVDFDMSLYPNLADSANGCTIPNGKIVSFHSPVDLHIYDQGGNHVGPNKDGDLEINIPGVSYEVIEGNKFAFLPEGIEYIIKGNATDSGTFNVRVETVQDEKVLETKYFNQIPITSTSQIELKDNSVFIDNDSDGIFELEFPVSAILDENESTDITKPVTFLVVTRKKKDTKYYSAPVKVTLSATDDNSGILKTEYSKDRGQSWVTYTKKFTISTKGDNELLYRSIDRAGNIEASKTVVINILYPGNSGNKK